MKDIVILGAGGFAREAKWVIDSINEQSLTWNFLGFIDKDINHEKNVIGNDDFVQNFNKELYAICAVADPLLKKAITEKVSKNPFVKFATLIHPSVTIASDVLVGEGSIIAANSIISVNASIGKYNIINFGCFIGHDSRTGDYCTINSDAKISGNVKIGDLSLIGAGAIIVEKVSIGCNVIISLGSIVLTNIIDNCTAMGYPARPITKKEKNNV